MNLNEPLLGQSSPVLNISIDPLTDSLELGVIASPTTRISDAERVMFLKSSRIWCLYTAFCFFVGIFIYSFVSPTVSDINPTPSLLFKIIGMMPYYLWLLVLSDGFSNFYMFKFKITIVRHS